MMKEIEDCCSSSADSWSLIASNASRDVLAYGFAAAVSYAGLNTAIHFADSHMTIWHIIFCRSLLGVVIMGLLARATRVAILGG